MGDLAIEGGLLMQWSALGGDSQEQSVQFRYGAERLGKVAPRVVDFQLYVRREHA